MWVNGLLVAALDVGEGIVVGSGIALELWGQLLEVVCGVGILATGEGIYSAAGGRTRTRTRQVLRTGDLPDKRLGVKCRALVVLVHGHHGHGDLLVGPGHGL